MGENIKNKRRKTIYVGIEYKTGEDVE